MGGKTEQGCEDVLEQMFREYSRMVTAYLAGLVGNWETAMELAQDTFVVAHGHLGSFDRSRSAGPWLRGIARNLARNAMRKAGRHREVLVESDVMENAFAAECDSGRDRTEERLRVLEGCVGKLPERQRDVVEMFYQGETSARDVGERLGIQEKSVFQTLWEARRSLKRCMESVLGTGGQTA